MIRPFDIGRGLIGERAERIVLNGSERSILILTRFGQKIATTRAHVGRLLGASVERAGQDSCTTIWLRRP
ncbi:hypothetical protein RBWH47_04095 [Rhodopirellula baltica WH47]|uniref:Uncharacterized protein n=1 Tax=Rhodopirellula baltica WH47 TaxID=991778 RepID=F2AL57_RHOBT|nr:hypothetical protein RBWH47_04095 [Rhodopirellula baltica WH47]